MTDGERPETWKAIPGFSKYEAGDLGHIRNAATGKPLAARVGTHGYLEVKPYDGDGKRQTRTVHGLVLLTFAGPRPDGQETRHLDDDPFNNRWAPGDEAETQAAGGNLIYGTKAANVEDTFRNGRQRAVPPPERHCVLCDAVLTTNGRRCHDCVVRLGVAAAGLLRGGHDPADVAVSLDYPHVDGIVRLAVVHGGYGVERLSRWQRITATVRHLFRRTDRSHGK